MAEKTIMWGDGTADTLTVTYTGGAGSSELSVSSDPNRSLVVRTLTVSLRSGGVTLASLTVSQKARSRAYSMSYNESYK